MVAVIREPIHPNTAIIWRPSPGLARLLTSTRQAAARRRTRYRPDRQGCASASPSRSRAGSPVRLTSHPMTGGPVTLPALNSCCISPMVAGVKPAGEGAARDPGLDRTHRGADAPRGGLLPAGRRRREGAVRHTELADLRTAINTMDPPISDRPESAGAELPLPGRSVP
jgi:hypothetical protein